MTMNYWLGYWPLSLGFNRLKRLNIFLSVGLAVFLWAQTASALEPESLLHFAPRAKDFAPELRPVVQHIQLGLQAADDQVKAAEFQQSIDLGNDLVTKIPRGFHSDLHLLLGFAYEQISRDEDALASYTSATALSVRNITALFRRGMVLKKRRQIPAALTVFQEALWQAHQSQEEILYAMADCLFEEGRKPEALQFLEQSQKKKPQFVDAVSLLVKIRLSLLADAQNPQDKQAIENQLMADLDHLMQVKPDEHDSILLFARMLMQRSDPLYGPEGLTRARNLTEQLVNKSSSKDVEAVALLFDIYLKQRNFAAAEKVLSKGLSQSPSAPLLQAAKTQLAIERQASETLQVRAGNEFDKNK